MADSRRAGTSLALVVLGGYWLVIFAATHVPLPPRELPATQLDKLVHAVMYAGFAFLIAWNGSARGWRRGPTALVVLAGTALYGVLDELSQIPVGRSAELADWLADLAGGVLGLAAFWLVAAVVRRRPR